MQYALDNLIDDWGYVGAPLIATETPTWEGFQWMMQNASILEEAEKCCAWARSWSE